MSQGRTLNLMTVLRGVVSSVAVDGRPYVQVSALAGGEYKYGPLDVAVPAAVLPGARVLVTLMGGSRDDLVVTGVLGASAASGAGVEIVVHNDDPDVPRPDVALVHWVGEAWPANALPTDIYTRRNI